MGERPNPESIDSLEIEVVPPGAVRAPDSETSPKDVGGEEAPKGPSLLRNPQTARFIGAQFASSLGDWIGLVAILALSARLAAGTVMAIFGPGIVLMTRTVPGFLFGQLAGPLVDRWDRKKVMVICDVIRGLLIAFLPFVPNLWVLVLNQLFFELVTMLWQPAKEASVPDVVPPDQISRANSLGQIAAYGMFPVGALIFAGLAQLASILGTLPFFKAFGLNQESLALFIDSATFFVSALLISGVHMARRDGPKRKLDFTLAIREVREGYREINRNPTVRTVIFGMTTAVFGAGSVVSLGAIFVQNDLAGGASGFGVMMTALGTGAGVGVLLAETVGKKIRRPALYSTSILLAGVALLLAAMTATLNAAVLFISLIGFFAAPAYIAGLTVVHENANEEFRGRSFAALLSLTRLSLMLALAISPILAGALSGIVTAVAPAGAVSAFGIELKLSGTRVTFWLSGAIVITVGIITGLRFWSGAASSKAKRTVEEESRLRKEEMPAAGTDPFRPTRSIEMSVDELDALVSKGAASTRQGAPLPVDETPVVADDGLDDLDRRVRARHDEMRERRMRWRREDRPGGGR